MDVCLYLHFKCHKMKLNDLNSDDTRRPTSTILLKTWTDGLLWFPTTLPLWKTVTNGDDNEGDDDKDDDDDLGIVYKNISLYFLQSMKHDF